MKKKILITIGFTILFLGTSITPTIANENVKKSSISFSNGKTLYVGGTGGENYTNIQDAIDNSSNGYTVFVFDESSPYFENLVVNKSINIIGEDKNTTIIDGSRKASTIHLIADRINISGFTIQKGGKYHPNAGILVHESDYTNIYDNIISDNDAHGILYKQSAFARISNNVIKENDEFGIGLISRSNNVTIQSNEISYNYAGIAGFYGTKDYFVYRNSIIFNEMVGVYFEGTSNLISYNNDIINKKANAWDNYPKNEWENETFGGNYWGDYDGVDNDGDGIGDTSYKFDFNSDKYPLMNPILGMYVDGRGPYLGNIEVAINFESTVHGGVGPYQWLWEFGDGDISNEQNPSHEFSSPGIYYVKVTVVDDQDKTVYDIVTVKISHPSGTTLYVDDDYNESAPGWEYDHFNEIHNGIDLCGKNGTVFVYKGFYSDSWCKRSVLIYAGPEGQSQYITIKKPLTLLGENKDNTIIDGGDKAEVIKIKADGVTLSGFTIKGYVYAKWGVSCLGNDCVISYNRIYGEGRCIIIRASSVKIFGNELTSTQDSPLEIVGCNNIEIYRNNITNCDGPYFLMYNKKIKIYENNFIDTDLKYGFWVGLFFSQFFKNSKTNFSKNYWNRPRLLPKIIIGYSCIFIYNYFIPFPLPVVAIDWHPAKEPYAIDV